MRTESDYSRGIVDALNQQSEYAIDTEDAARPMDAIHAIENGDLLFGVHERQSLKRIAMPRRSPNRAQRLMRMLWPWVWPVTVACGFVAFLWACIVWALTMRAGG
jgi:hypothetical protein